jgi:hypothetical protein
MRGNQLRIAGYEVREGVIKVATARVLEENNFDEIYKILLLFLGYKVTMDSRVEIPSFTKSVGPVASSPNCRRGI